MINTADIVGTTFRIAFVVNITSYANVNASQIVNCYSNGKLVLKYKKGGGVGYDGDILQDPSNARIFYVTMTKTDAEKVRAGKLYLEAQIDFSDDEYPDGRRINIKTVIKDIEKFNTKVE